MSVMTCRACEQIQPQARERCCPAAYEAELQALRVQVAEQADEIRGLRDEVEVLEALRREVTQAAEDQGVYL